MWLNRHFWLISGKYWEITWNKFLSKKKTFFCETNSLKSKQTKAILKNCREKQSGQSTF